MKLPTLLTSVILAIGIALGFQACGKKDRRKSRSFRLSNVVVVVRSDDTAPEPTIHGFTNAPEFIRGEQFRAISK